MLNKKPEMMSLSLWRICINFVAVVCVRVYTCVFIYIHTYIHAYMHVLPAENMCLHVDRCAGHLYWLYT
jgi:hypothetical protein